MDIQALILTAGDALIVVDVQNDFLPGGAVPVPRGREIIEPLNRCMALFSRLGLPIYVCRDWHPTYHCSFRLQGGPWPPHCMAGLWGAEAPAQLRIPVDAHAVFKGTVPVADAYSALQMTGLAVVLRNGGCRRVFIGGLATEHCVRVTALDALAAGFEAIVIEDAVRPLEAHPGDGQRALAELSQRGVRMASVASLATAPAH